MHNLPRVEFYITNVCNLNCTNCNRFNNYAFSGHQLWSTYKDQYREWSKRLEFKSIGILGGEPLLNPEFLDWINGLSELWPTTKLNILSNGTQLDRWPELYNLILESNNQIQLKFSIHGKSLKQSTISKIENFLHGDIVKKYDRMSFPDSEWQNMWEIIRGPDWPDCPSADDYYLLPLAIQQECETHHDLGPQIWTDANGVSVQVTLVNYFVNSTIIPDIESQSFNLYNSDPDKAVNNCMSKYCHHFVRGKLYKCNIVSILPEFDDQYYVNMSDEDRELLLMYRPAEHDWSDESLANFLTDLKTGKSIQQCKFCPETYASTRFDAGTKKIKFLKKSKELKQRCS